MKLVRGSSLHSAKLPGFVVLNEVGQQVDEEGIVRGDQVAVVIGIGDPEAVGAESAAFA